MKQNDPFAFRFFTPRNLLCLLAGFGLYMGWRFQNPALLALGVFSFSTVAISLFQAWRLLPDASVERHHTPRTFEQQTIPVQVELHSPTRRGPALVLVQDYFPAASYTRFRHLIQRPFRKGESVLMAYMAACTNRRGIYTNGPIQLEAHDPLGLVSKKLILNSFTDILLYPSTTELELFQVLGNGTLEHVGFETILRAGDSTEFTGLRPYRQGDARNRIHWKLAARNDDHFQVKEFQESITTEVALFVDCSRLGLTGLGEQTSLEYAVKAAGSVARVALEKAHHVELFLVGKETEHLPSGSGQDHLLLLLDRLSFAKAEHDAHFFGEVHKKIPLLKRGGTVVLFVSLTTVELDALDAIVSSCVARSITLIIIGVDDRAFIKLYREQEVRHGKAPSVEEMARLLALRGVRVHVLRKSKFPLQGLREDLEQPVQEGAA